MTTMTTMTKPVNSRGQIFENGQGGHIPSIFCQRQKGKEMASVEIIGLLCAGSTHYHSVSGCNCLSGHLARAELAGMLAGLDQPAMNLALAKYALDITAERNLIAHVRVYAAGIAVRENWHIVRGRPTMVNMSALAVFESVRPNRCGRCSGRGFVAYRLCNNCNGSGFKALSGRRIAEIIGVEDSDYKRKWRPRYQGLIDYMQALDSSVNRALHFADKDCNISVINY